MHPCAIGRTDWLLITLQRCRLAISDSHKPDDCTDQRTRILKNGNARSTQLGALPPSFRQRQAIILATYSDGTTRTAALCLLTRVFVLGQQRTHRLGEAVGLQVLRVQHVAQVCQLLRNGGARACSVAEARLVPPHHVTRAHTLPLLDHLQVAVHKDGVEDLQAHPAWLALSPLAVAWQRLSSFLDSFVKRWLQLVASCSCELCCVQSLAPPLPAARAQQYCKYKPPHLRHLGPKRLQRFVHPCSQLFKARGIAVSLKLRELEVGHQLAVDVPVLVHHVRHLAQHTAGGWVALARPCRPAREQRSRRDRSVQLLLTHCCIPLLVASSCLRPRPQRRSTLRGVSAHHRHLCNQRMCYGAIDVIVQG